MPFWALDGSSTAWHPVKMAPHAISHPLSIAESHSDRVIKPASLPGTRMAPMVSVLPTSAIVTRREWVIPPRPKPGRKPATDTPPTKRKAQNRAAQRAFRERRAARVGELEEELEDTREEQHRCEAEMRKKIASLEAEIQRLNGELESWRLRCGALDQIAEYERRERKAALVELAYIRDGAFTSSSDAVPIPPRRPRHQETREPPTLQHGTDSEERLGCGNCSPTSSCACVEQAIAISTSICGRCNTDGRCECLEETIKAASEMPTAIDLKRAHSPSTEGDIDKRHRVSDPSTLLEVDFTAQFSKPKQHVHSGQDTELPGRPHAEPCGFCEDGTYCVCAEAAATAVDVEQKIKTKLPPLLNEITPPPSDTDVGGTTSKPSALHPAKVHLSASSNTWIDGPGTCEQCQRDPKSSLFCRSLAALRESGTSTSSAPEGCCGGNESGGPCCRSLSAAQPTRPPPSLSCADTYRAISTHKNFDQVSHELTSWLGRLDATSTQHSGRGPMEVEAASVMGVLKLFDRRFGSG